MAKGTWNGSAPPDSPIYTGGVGVSSVPASKPSIAPSRPARGGAPQPSPSLVPGQGKEYGEESEAPKVFKARKD